MSAEGTLGAVPATKRTCATVLYDGQRHAYWSGAGDEVERTSTGVPLRRTPRGAWLWRNGTIVGPVPPGELRGLPLVAVATIYRPDVAPCVRRDHPEAPPTATQCPACGARIVPAAEATGAVA